MASIIVGSGISQYQLDEVVYQGNINTPTFSGKIVVWDSANNTLQLSSIYGAATSDVLVGLNSSATRFVQSYVERELEPYTGTLLYIDNMKPVVRSIDQTEDYKIVLRF